MKAALCAALYPNAAVKDESAGKAARPAWNDGVADVYIHPSSINHPLEAQQFLRPYMVYLSAARSCLSVLHAVQIETPMMFLRDFVLVSGRTLPQMPKKRHVLT